jgi:ribosomal protein L37E
MSEWAGYRKLRPGRIHIYCPKCGRKHSNGYRNEYDPPRAELVHTWCERCGAGGKDLPETYLDAKGREISYDEIDAHIKRQTNG